MNWNGVIGSVASVVNTALPLFLGGVRGSVAAAAAPPATRVGPATLFQEGGVLKFGNFGIGEGVSNVAPLMMNFSSPEGVTTQNLAVSNIPFGTAFPADTWLQQYSHGQVTIGVAETPDATAKADGPIQSIFSFLTHVVLTTGTSITAVVNPTLRLLLTFRVEANGNVVAVVAIGTLGYLGSQWMLTATNNAGQAGSRSGTLAPDPQATAGENETTFTLPLPSGIDYSAGIYALEVQIAVNLEGAPTATHPDVVFETIAPEKIQSLRYL